MNASDCDEVRDLRSVYVDGELGPAKRVRVDGHLEVCPDCSLYYEELRQLRDDLDSARQPVPPVSPESTEQLLTRARREFALTAEEPVEPSPFSGGTRKTQGILLTAVALVVGLCIGGYLGLGFLRSIEDPRVPSVLQPSPDEEPIVSSERPPVSVEVVSFSDAYFEVPDDRSSESDR